MSKKEIPIALGEGCYKLEYTWDHLVESQGTLKDLTQEGYNNLKRSVLKHHFFRPVVIWKGPTGTEFADRPYLLDGHQRKRLFVQENWRFKDTQFVPTATVIAPTKELAAEILLRHDSQHGTRSGQGLYEFLHNFDLSVDDLAPMDLPDFDWGKFKTEFYEELTDEEESAGEDEMPPEQWMVVIIADNEKHQIEMLERFNEEGLQCRALQS